MGILIFSVLFAVCSGLLYLEAFMAVPEAQHIYTVSRRLTGRIGNLFASFFFYIYTYSLMIEGYSLFAESVHELFPKIGQIYPLVIFLLLTLSAVTVSLGKTFTFSIVSILLVFLLGFLGYAVYAAAPLSWQHPKTSGFSYYNIYLLGASFSYFFYQSFFPLIITFLKRDRKKIVLTLWISFALSASLQILWIFTTLRPDIYKHFLALFETATFHVHNFNFLDFLPKFRLAYFAMAIILLLQNILSLGISFRDFFIDTKHAIFNTHKFNELITSVLIFLFPWLLHLALGGANFQTAGAILIVTSSFFIACFFPVMWVWSLRYHYVLEVKPVLFGGKKMLVAMIVASILFFFILWLYPQKMYW